VIARLSDEATDLRDKSVRTAWRVRALPYGQDRFHRLYWALPHAGVVVVESVESVQHNNAACDLAACADDSPAIDGTFCYSSAARCFLGICVIIVHTSRHIAMLVRSTALEGSKIE
jgi:hypothetical protein